MKLAHLMADNLLDACGTAARGQGLTVFPYTVPEQITCPACRPLVDEQRRQVLERDHAEALEEDAAHDAAMTKAQDLTPQLLTRYADAPRPMPRSLRTRLAHQRQSLVPPW